jgi:hypothetical protein
MVELPSTMMNKNNNMHNIVHWKIVRATGGEWKARSPNLRTNDGINFQAELMGGDTGFDGTVTGALPKQLAVTEDTTAPSSAQTNLWAELAADGMSRKTATYSHTADASSYTQTASWQYTGGSTVTVATAAMASTLTDVDATASVDTHFLITAVSPVAVLNSNDTLEIQWGVFY